MHACYAESKDGIRWERPKLGLFEFRGSKENNIVYASHSTAPWPETSNFAPFKDVNPGAPASERYKASGGITNGLFGFVSSDGIHWKQKGDAPFFLMVSFPDPGVLLGEGRNREQTGGPTQKDDLREQTLPRVRRFHGIRILDSRNIVKAAYARHAVRSKVGIRTAQGSDPTAAALRVD